MVIYICDKCHFMFQRSGSVDSCPDCGKSAVREATEQEQEEFHKNLSENYGSEHEKRL